MAIRITCKFCKAALTFDDDKAGKKVRCRKCEELLSLPAAAPAKKKRDDDEAFSAKSRLKVKARSRRDDDEDDEDEDDDDDDRPRKKKGQGKKDSSAMMLAIGAAVLGVVLLIGGGSLTAYFIFRKAPPANNPLAKQDENREKGIGAPNAENPGKAAPDKLSDDTLARVKQATVYIRVQLPNGQTGTGSGFLAMEPELIVTNAHVVGMLAPNAPPPRSIEIFLNSGQPNELKMAGTLLGVDRSSDLAVIRVNNKNLPPPLPVDADRKLTELQRVYIFGFPFGESLGKAITVSESSVSSLRLDGRNELDRIQVHGGIQPGNSGGPVVNAQGSVVGVAVSIIKGTQINFAVPAAKIPQAMEGRVSETKLEQAILENGQIKLPIKLVSLDPLRRISQVRLDVWTGMPGQPRNSATQQPQPLPGDGARQTHPVNYQNGIGTIELSLANAPAGQVYWVQPIVTNAAGTHWGLAVPTPANLYPIERKPGDLTINYTNIKERTVKLKSSQGLSVLVQNDYKNIVASTMEVDLVEAVTVEPSDAKLFRIRTLYGNTNLTLDVSDKPAPQEKRVVDLFRAMLPIHLLDGTNRFQRRVDKLLNAKLDPILREDAQGAYGQFCNSVEAVMMIMPNRMVQPNETWQTKLPLMLRGGGPKTKPLVVDLAVTCTYQGTRTRDQRAEGIMTVTGKVEGRDAQSKNIQGEVSGKIGLDLQGGFISYGQMRIDAASTIKLDGGNDLPANDYFDIELTRVAGNTLNIPIPPEPKAPVGPAPVAGGKLVFQQKGVLALNDPYDTQLFKQTKMKKHFKTFPVKMEANKTYVISLSSAAFDSYLGLARAGAGVGFVAEDDNSGGGKNARITYRPQQDGFFIIAAVSNDGKTGAFELTIHEMP